MREVRRFGTAGARGITNLEITPELTSRIAAAFAQVMVGRRRGTFAVGHDTRFGAAMLARAAAAGLASAGHDVIELGCVSTGAFSVCLAEHGCAGGILITGSHMPPDRIGVIPMLPDGAYAPARITDRVEAMMRRSKGSAKIPPSKLGDIRLLLSARALYVDRVTKLVNKRSIRRRRFKVLVDPANGTACELSYDLFPRLGCRLTVIHGDPRPVPQRPSEPRAHTVQKACREVKKNRCDLGICFDVDADRVLFIDEHGIPISEDVAGSIFALRELKRGDTCVTPVNSSGLIEETCRKAGARLKYCRIGQPPTVEAIKKHHARFAYEESGKYYFPRHYVFADGLIAALKLLEIMARERKSCSQLAAEAPRYAQVKQTVPVPDGRKDTVMSRVRNLWKRELLNNRDKDITIDGLKRVYRDNSWLLIRKSGTEPLIRVYADAPTRARAEELVSRGKRLVMQVGRKA